MERPPDNNNMIDFTPRTDTFILPKFDPIVFFSTVNYALKQGVDEVVVELNTFKQNQNTQKAEEFCNKFTEFDAVIQEIVNCKLNIYYKAIEDKTRRIIRSDMLRGFQKEQQLLNEIHCLLYHVINRLNLQFQIERKKEKEAELKKDKSQSKSLAKVQSSLKLRQREMKNLELKSTNDELFNQLQQRLNEFRKVFTDNMSNEEDIMNSCQQQLSSKVEDLILVGERLFITSYNMKLIPWVICHLTDQKDQLFFAQSLKIAMPYRFSTDVMEWLEFSLPGNIWTSLHSSLVLVGELDPSDHETSSDRECSITTTTSSGNLANSEEEFEMERRPKKKGSLRKKSTRRKDDRSLKLTKSDGGLHSHLEVPNPNAKKVFPISLLALTRKVILQKLQKLGDKLKAGTPTLSFLEESIDVFVYLNIKDLQDDLCIFPLLSRADKKCREVTNLLEVDHKSNANLLKTLFTLFSALRENNSNHISPSHTPSHTPSPTQSPLPISASSSNVLSPPSSPLEDFVSELSKTTILFHHAIWKEDVLLPPLIEKHVPIISQQKIIRELFDISPSLYLTRMLPWVYRNLMEDDQFTFIESLKLSISKSQFHTISMTLKKIHNK